MKVSIIVSLYRSDRHLKRFVHDARTLSDELNKNAISHEVILVVNNATEVEQNILRELSTPFKVLFGKREPIYTSWNRGIREASGEFVTFWGVDDTRYAGAIIEGLNTAQKSKAHIIYFPFRYYRFVKIFGLMILVKVKTFIPPEFERGRFQKEMHLGPHFMVQRALFDRIGYFDELFKIAGDYEFQTRAAKKGVRFARTLVISGIFRNDGTTLSGSRNELHVEENKRILSHV